MKHKTRNGLPILEKKVRDEFLKSLSTGDPSDPQNKTLKTVQGFIREITDENYLYASMMIEFGLTIKGIYGKQVDWRRAIDFLVLSYKVLEAQGRNDSPDYVMPILEWRAHDEVDGIFPTRPDQMKKYTTNWFKEVSQIDPAYNEFLKTYLPYLDHKGMRDRTKGFLSFGDTMLQEQARLDHQKVTERD